MTTTLLVIALVVLVIGSGFFSSSEVAYFYLNPLEIRRMQESHPGIVRRVEQIIAKPTVFLSTILIGNTMVNVAIAFVSFSLFLELTPRYSEVAAIVFSLSVLLIFGEIGPKRVAVAYPERIAALYAGPLQFFIVILKPLRVMLQRVTTTLDHLFAPHGKNLSEEEFETLVDLSREEGVLDHGESEMVKGIIRLEDLRAGDVMTPRVDIVGVDLEDQQLDVVALARKARRRHLLVYQDQLDKVVGTLDVRRFLLDPNHRISSALVIPPLYVPEACPLNKLLNLLLKADRRTAVVVDEYGGTAGLVTRGDILEEIITDFDQEGSGEFRFESGGRNRWIIDGRVSLEDIQDDLGITFEEEGVDRIGGWLTARLERLPRRGDLVDQEAFQLRALRVQRNRVTLVELTRKEKRK